MKVLLALMAFTYIAGSRYMDAVLQRAQSSPVEEAQRVKRYKPAIALTVLAKFGLVIGVFVIFFLQYQTLRYWVGSVCFLIGMEALWAGFSKLRSARKRNLPITSSPERAVELFERATSSLRAMLMPFLSSGVLLVAVTVFIFNKTQLHLYLSLWDLGGVVFFFASYHVWFVLYIRYSDVMVEKLHTEKGSGVFSD
jgi:hypothetical protein